MLPFNFLATVLCVALLITVDIDTSVDSSSEVIDDLHELGRVSTEVETLLETRTDVPIELFQLVIRVVILMDHVKEEVESKLDLVHILSHFSKLVKPVRLSVEILVNFHLHDLEVIFLNLLLRVEHSEICLGLCDENIFV